MLEESWRHQLFYMVLWLVLTFTMSIEQSHAFKWLLLATDIMLIIASITVCVGHIIDASSRQKGSFVLYHQCDHDGYLDEISDFGEETSGRPGNSKFIREPLVITVVLGWVFSLVTMFYEYKMDLVLVFQ